jgi:hypothetical protein
MINKFIKWHKEKTEYMMKELNLSYYSVMWIAFGEGLIVGIITAFILFE